ncbi:MAG: tRNA pseudouridine(54/55) synthase Pus10 [Candidatus Bathyarchaeota archaeon]|nr:tRNA pseudouridine(54/55) synthase Pus10 [Candidatus Bathyarchaeota archaeon]
MSVLEKALQLLEAHALCDNCLGRQFALLGYDVANSERGRALKLSLALQASAFALLKDAGGVRSLKVLAVNGFCREAAETLRHLKKRVPKQVQPCFLCEGRFQSVDRLVSKALAEVEGYEFTSFLVGVELPVEVEEREDEFKAAHNVSYGESIRHEFGRLIGKGVEARSGKTVDYRAPDLVIIVNPFTESVKLQVNPLFVAGRYRKLVRDIPQSKWFCSRCRGRGCEQCGGTGLLYPESVEAFVSKPLLEAAEGERTAFHASGREDIDARMLGSGRPFVVEVSKPRKRFLDLPKLKEAINVAAAGKVEVSNLRFTSKVVVRRLKKAESAQKEYRVLAEFEEDVSEEDLQAAACQLSNVVVKQQTPLRVLHRRADLMREKYIYWVKVKKVSPKLAELQIRCQGGLYVKELVSGDEGRTKPSVSGLLGKRAKPLKLDVLNVIMDEVGEVKK